MDCVGVELTFCELRAKEVVNASDGRKLGRITDLVFSADSGAVKGIVAPFTRRGRVYTVALYSKDRRGRDSGRNRVDRIALRRRSSALPAASASALSAERRLRLRYLQSLRSVRSAVRQALRKVYAFRLRVSLEKIVSDAVKLPFSVRTRPFFCKFASNRWTKPLKSYIIYG